MHLSDGYCCFGLEADVEVKRAAASEMSYIADAVRQNFNEFYEKSNVVGRRYVPVHGSTVETNLHVMQDCSLVVPL